MLIEPHSQIEMVERSERARERTHNERVANTHRGWGAKSEKRPHEKVMAFIHGGLFIDFQEHGINLLPFQTNRDLWTFCG